MRRAITAAVIGGLMLCGAVATPSLAAARGEGKGPGKAHQAVPAKPRAASKPKAASKPRAHAKPATGMKTVVYAGYEFQVPASWPVYRLDEHPQTCVRYDVPAVYLGKPGANMRCTAGLVGRTQTVSFIPGQGAATGPVAGSPSRSAAADGAAGTELQRLPAVHGAVTQNAVQHTLAVALGAAGPAGTVVGTYGADPGVLKRVLDTVRRAPAGTAPTGQSASVPSQPGGAAAETSQRARLSAERAPLAPQRAPAGPAPAKKAAAQTTPGPVSTDWRGVPAHWPVEIIQSSPSPSPSSPPRSPSTPRPSPSPPPVNGFDTCTAPSPSTMRAWHRAYAAVGIYIGGTNTACAAGNLSAGWVKTVTGMGWGLLPAYVGPQAPCWGSTGVLIKPGSATAEGKAAAADAVSDARAVGLAAGSPIYYDMEAYKGSASCTRAVLNFLGAWDRQVTAAGYVTGVYSSQASGIVDMQAAAVSKTPGFTPPRAVWTALWDNVASLRDGNVIWPLTDRNKQYEGNVNQTIGGIALNIDKDLVGGPVAGGLVEGLPPGSRGTGN